MRGPDAGFWFHSWGPASPPSSRGGFSATFGPTSFFRPSRSSSSSRRFCSFPSRYPHGRWLGGLVAGYAAALLFEVFDRQVKATIGFTGGHPLKHLAAAAGHGMPRLDDQAAKRGSAAGVPAAH